MSLSAELFYRFEPRAVLGEGPIYRFSDNTLHFNDCGANKVHIVAVDPETGNVDTSRPPVTHHTADKVSVQYFRKNKPGYIVLYHEGIGFLDEKTGELEVVKQINPDRSTFRMNDGVVDPQGNFWGGEVDQFASKDGIHHIPAEVKGRLWRYEPNGTLTEMDTGLVCSNGIAWSPDYKIMYLNDSVGQKTFAYDWDNATSSISNRRVLRDWTDTNEEPDGLVSDVDGNLWSAMWGGHRVVKLSPKGEILEEVQIPTARPTCPTWGGKDNDTLFVTSATKEGDESSGYVYKIQTRTHGMPNFEFNG